MTSKTTTKTTRKNSLKKSQKKSHRINRQRRLQKQLQMLVLERHSRKCIICHHPEREAIEEEFLHWRAPWKLAEDYNLADYRTLYRHARAAGILPKRRENLRSALDAFVEAVDDVKFTPDSILRAMRAYSCIDRHGRWTEIPTQVHISTFHDVGPTQSPALHQKNGSSVIDIDPDQLEEDTEDEPDDDPDDTPDDDNDPKNESEADSLEETTACAASPAQSVSTGSSNSLYSGPNVTATACAVSSAQAFNVSNSDADFDGDPDDEPPAQAVSGVRLNSNHRGRNVTATSCAGLPRPSRGSPAQQVPKMPLGNGRNVTATTCAAPPAQAPPRNEVRGHNPKDRSPSDRTDCAALPRPSRGSPAQNAARRAAQVNRSQLQEETGRSATITTRAVSSKLASRSDATACAVPPAQDDACRATQVNRHQRQQETRRRATATACADSPAQALPRNEVRGPNPQDRSASDRTDCATSPAQPAAPQKPKPDADGLIWHKRPGYPNREVSEPDAQGRICYKISMTPVASQLPPPETDARRAAELIYCSAIKKYGKP
jgi:hypothetical protein